MTRSSLGELLSTVEAAIVAEGLRPLAKRTGLPIGVIRAAQAKLNLKAESVEKLAVAFGYEFYLGPPRHDGTFLYDGTITYSGEPVVTASAPDPVGFELGGEDFAPIPLRETMASAGAGMCDQGMDPVGSLAFRRTWLARMGIPAARASLIRVRGDSMVPHLRDGDVILVHRTDQADIRDGDIYVLRVGPDLFVKRLFRAKVGYVATSDNPTYPPIVMDQRDDTQAIEGRVRWIGRDVTGA